MDKINTIIVEEHNEAFYVWLWAYKKNIIKKVNNLLLHFDDHSDMSTPRFNTNFSEVHGWSLKMIEEFANKELGISNFIVPTIYLGTLNTIYWIKNEELEPISIDMFVDSYDEEFRYLFSGNKNILTSDSVSENIKYFTYHKLRPDDLLHFDFSNKDILLDIDLDYFSCIDNPFSEKEVMIEITKEEYEEFINNKYHFLNFLVNKIEAIKYKNEYYYVINYFKNVYPSIRKVDKSMINNRISNLIQILERKNIYPKLITICRSRFSGFTPEDQWQYIEKGLINKLKSLYALEVKYIGDIV